MKITLVQAEIEEAIRAFVLSRMSINDGMRLQIDLAATRGSTGFTADVDVVPEVETAPLGVAKKVTAAKKTAAKVAADPAPVATTIARQEPAPEAEKQHEPEAEAGAVQQPAPDASDDSQKPAPEVEEAAPAPKTSLFGNLGRPVNEKTAEA